jgi:signal peptidase II
MPSLPRLLCCVTLPLYVLDQVTKWWVVRRFEPPSITGGVDGFPVIEGYFNLVRVHNTGVAFGLGNGTAWAPVVFLLVPLVALVVIAVLWRRGLFVHRLSHWALALLLTGIFGNLTDRLIQGFLLAEWSRAPFWVRLSKGYVVDFLDFTIPLVNYRWPAFNVADSCICVAAVMLFFAAGTQGDGNAPARGRAS